MIDVVGLSRQFTTTVREPGLRNALGSIVRRRTRLIDAVTDVTFSVEPGVVLGLLGPNGSGKTTTLKCLSGLLTPTSGSVRVLGHIPHRRDPELLRRIGFVMGQRWQLHPDIPVLESFELHRVIYDLEPAPFRRTRDELLELLELDDLVRAPARKLSLGQRMRCEFVVALLHRPSVVLLDEPTLGLDFEAQLVIRRFVAAYVATHRAAVVLTSHYLADIEALSDRVLAISRGRITFEGSLDELKGMAGDRKRVSAAVTSPAAAERVAAQGSVVERTPARVVLEVPRRQAGATVAALEGIDGVADISLGDLPLEDTLRSLYAAGSRP